MRRENQPWTKSVAALERWQQNSATVATAVFQAPLSPSPQPSPSERGRHLIPLSKKGEVPDCRRTGKRFSLSLRERAGVRGKRSNNFTRLRMNRNLIVVVLAVALLTR